MAINTLLVVYIQVRWQLYAAAKTDIRSLTAPRTTRRRKSGFSAPLKQIPAPSRVDQSVSVEGSAVGLTLYRQLWMTTSSQKLTIHLLHHRVNLSGLHRHGPGQHLPVSRKIRRQRSVTED